MNISDAYRTDVNTAVKYFRPILARLSLRNRDYQNPVYLAEFPHLDFLNLDNIVVKVLVADLGQTNALFFCREGQAELLYCYIVINEKFYSSNDLEMVKLVGTHEFCHFMALIYSVTATTIELQRKNLLKRISEKLVDLQNISLDIFYSYLLSKEKDNNELQDFEDSHFRLGFEGETVDYDVLFKYFLFSKELFEKYFDKKKQQQFTSLIKSQNEEQILEAFQLYVDTVVIAANDKSVRKDFAKKQAFTWASDYVIINL